MLTMLSIIYFCVLFRHGCVVQGTNGRSPVFVRGVGSCVRDKRVGSTVGCYHAVGAPSTHVVRGNVDHLKHPMGSIRITVRGIKGVRITGLRGKLAMVTAVSNNTPVLNFLNAMANVIQTFCRVTGTKDNGVSVALLSKNVCRTVVAAINNLVINVVTVFTCGCLIVLMSQIIGGVRSEAVRFVSLLGRPTRGWDTRVGWDT